MRGARLAAAGARGCRRPQERPECLLARGIGCSGPSGVLPRAPRGPLHRASPAPVPARGRVSRSCVACWGRWVSLLSSLSGSPGPPPPGLPAALCSTRGPPARAGVPLCRAGPVVGVHCPLLPLGPLHSLNLLFPRPACLAYARPPRASESRAPPRALQARPSGDRRALRRTGAPRRVVSPGGGRSATGHGAGARGRAGREAGCALRGGQRRAPGRGGAALPGRATAGLAARGGRSSRTGPPCSGPGASRVKLTCLTTV